MALLDGKTALVTGAGRGIGRAYVGNTFAYAPHRSVSRAEMTGTPEPFVSQPGHRQPGRANVPARRKPHGRLRPDVPVAGARAERGNSDRRDTRP